VNNGAQPAACLFFLLLMIFAPVPGRAADEDIAVSVYLTYDPVTGTLTEQTKPKAGHFPGPQTDPVVQGAEPAGEVQQATGEVTAQPDQQQATADESANNAPVLMTGAVAVVALVLMFGYFVHRNRRKFSS
jgi:hypothetical protein